MAWISVSVLLSVWLNRKYPVIGCSPKQEGWRFKEHSCGFLKRFHCESSLCMLIRSILYTVHYAKFSHESWYCWFILCFTVKILKIKFTLNDFKRFLFVVTEYDEYRLFYSKTSFARFYFTAPYTKLIRHTPVSNDCIMYTSAAVIYPCLHSAGTCFRYPPIFLKLRLHHSWNTLYHLTPQIVGSLISYSTSLIDYASSVGEWVGI